MASAFHRTFKLSITSHIKDINISKRHYSKGRRYTGYINKLIEEERIGHVVRNDEPQHEYFFTYNDLVIDKQTKTKFRPYVYQQIEFAIFNTESKALASRITGLHGKPFYNIIHKNLFIPRKEKTKYLIEEPEALYHRHTGVVFNISENGETGLIMPDKMYYNPLHFHKNAIQSTGIQQLAKWAEVEFDLKPKRNEQEFDQAVCITRSNGALITAERGVLGNRRRYLGSLYKVTDKYANIGNEYRMNRKHGYIAHVEKKDRLYGFILIFDNENDIENELLHVHVDECHMYGARKLRRFQQVEFIVSINNETGRKMATHVTGRNLEILRYHSENHFVSSGALFKHLNINKE
eukprot:2358_1